MGKEQELRAIEAAEAAFSKSCGGLLDGRPMENAIKAYLAALPSSDEQAEMRQALMTARAYVEQAVKDDGGIDNCEIGDRLALERIDAALAGRDEWQPIEAARKVADETVLLRIEHVNFSIAAADDKHRWEEIVTAYWTDFNGGGWVWHGLAGSPTHWHPLPTPPSRGEGE